MVAFDHLENYNYFSPTSKCGVVFLIESFHLTAKTGLCFRTLFFFSTLEMHPSHHPIFCGGQDRTVPLWVLKGVIKATGAPWQSGAQGESGGCPLGTGLFNCFFGGGKN